MKAWSTVGSGAARRQASGVSLFRGLLLGFCFCLGSCAFLMDPGPAPSRLQLTPAMPHAVTGGPVNRQLVISTPVAGREIDSDSIALIFQGREVRYLSDARWTGTVPFLVRRGIIEALEAANALRGVGDEMAGIAADARLLSDLRQFGLHYAAEGTVPTALFEASFRLVNLSNGKILSTRHIEAKVQASGKDKAALVRAMEAAFSQALAEATLWIAEEMQKMK